MLKLSIRHPRRAGVFWACLAHFSWRSRLDLLDVLDSLGRCLFWAPVWGGSLPCLGCGAGCCFFSTSLFSCLTSASRARILSLSSSGELLLLQADNINTPIMKSRISI